LCSEVRTMVKLRPDRTWNGAIQEAAFMTPHFQEKPLVRYKLAVPQTDTGRRDENSKALE